MFLCNVIVMLMLKSFMPKGDNMYLYNSFGPADIISAEGLINETIKYISQNISFISEYVGFWLFLMKQI